MAVEVGCGIYSRSLFMQAINKEINTVRNELIGKTIATPELTNRNITYSYRLPTSTTNLKTNT